MPERHMQAVPRVAIFRACGSKPEKRCPKLSDCDVVSPIGLTALSMTVPGFMPQAWSRDCTMLTGVLSERTYNDL